MGYLIGATVICIDYFYLTGSSKLQKQGQMFKTSFLIKLSFIITEIAFILAFRCTEQIPSIQQNTAAILEWGMKPVSFSCYPYHFRLLTFV
jgi:hypothetical protein